MLFKRQQVPSEVTSEANLNTAALAGNIMSPQSYHKEPRGGGSRAPMHLQIPRPEEKIPLAPGQPLDFAVGIYAGCCRQSAPPATAPAPCRAEWAKFPLAHALEWCPGTLDSMAMPQSVAHEKNCFSWLQSTLGKCSCHGSHPDTSPCHLFLWKSYIWEVVEMTKKPRATFLGCFISVII